MLRENLPPFVAAVPEIAELFLAEQPEIDRLEAAAEAMLREFSVGGITERTVELWEDLMGFFHAPDWPIERRRERIKSRLLTADRAMTPAALKEIIERVGGVEVEITENPDAYYALVTFVGQYGVPRYLEDIKREVELIRPFHITIGYEDIYATLDKYADFTLNSLAGSTLLELANGTPL